MSWIAAPAEDDGGPVAGAYDRDRTALGYVANFTKIFAHRPAVYEAWLSLNGAIKASMDPRRYELATLAAALRLRSSYCALAHGKVLVEQFDGPEAVSAIVTAPDSAPLTPVDRAVMALADKVAAGAAHMTESDLTELRDLAWTTRTSSTSSWPRRPDASSAACSTPWAQSPTPSFTPWSQQSAVRSRSAAQ